MASANNLRQPSHLLSVVLPKPERFSLVPYDNYRKTLIEVHRASNKNSKQADQRS